MYYRWGYLYSNSTIADYFSLTVIAFHVAFQTLHNESMYYPLQSDIDLISVSANIQG